MAVASVSHAGPLRAVEHGAAGASLFHDVALGPTFGASALVEARGVGARLSLGLALAVFEPKSQRDGALRFSVAFEGELQLRPGPLEGALLLSANVVSWRWLSVGAFAGVGLQGQQGIEAWTLRVGPEAAVTLHHAWGRFDGVLQLFVRGSIALLRIDVFSSQAVLGLRVLLDLA
jgi:hypothetical protein